MSRNWDQKIKAMLLRPPCRFLYLVSIRVYVRIGLMYEIAVLQHHELLETHVFSCILIVGRHALAIYSSLSDH